MESCAVRLQATLTGHLLGLGLGIVLAQPAGAAETYALNEAQERTAQQLMLSLIHI